MNERALSPQLLKLVQAAGPGYSLADPEWVNNFAKMIVQECVSVVESRAVEKPMSRYYIAQIKEHFGVDE